MFKKQEYDETAESCIEILSGTHPTHTFTGESTDHSDKSLLLSLAKQTFKGVGYTDRQYELAKVKINYYRNILESLDIDVDNVINNLRFPLRQIDRSRWISVQEIEGHPYIAVRFTFNKKLISVIDSLRTKENKKLYNENLKIHYFVYNEINVYKIISLLQDKNFIIDEELLRKYEIIEMMYNNKKDYVPGVYGFKLENLHSKAVEYIISDIGEEPNKENLALYNDRKTMYGIKHFDQDDLNESVGNLTALSQRIVRRNNTNILINPQEFNINHVIESILELNRYPVLICLDNKNDLDQLQMFYKSLCNIFSNDTFCTLYRKDNTTQDNEDFNNYIRENFLNNPLANNSKVVYTTQDKLVKTLLKVDWKPKSAFVFGASRANKIKPYLDELDLVMYYDTDISPFMRDIEKI